jgi:hypothetical protein
VSELLAIQWMLRGTFGTTFRRCGKPTCWCSDQIGHPYTRITWTENGHSNTKAIPDHDQHWIKRVTAAYRIYRSKRRQLQDLQQKLKLLLDQFETQVIHKTQKQRDYLG